MAETQHKTLSNTVRDRAVYWYEKALQITSGDPNVVTDLAVVYRNLGDPQRVGEVLSHEAATVGQSKEGADEATPTANAG